MTKRTLLAATMLTCLAAAGTVAADDPVQGLPQEKLVAIGKEIYMAKGPNTCNDCHGPAGTGGSRPAAANLAKPETWRSYLALGGDQQKIDVALVYLIRNGALQFTFKFAKQYPDIKYDWAKAGEPKYNAEMFGITQDATKRRIAELKTEIEASQKVQLTDDQMKDLAARAALAYVKTLKKS